MVTARVAYVSGVSDAKLAFFGELYDQHLKGNLGPFFGSLVTGSPAAAGIVGAAAQGVDTPPEGSMLLRSLGVGGGAAIANRLVNPIATFVASAVVSSLGLNPASFGTKLLAEGIRDIPTGLAQGFAATKGRDAAQGIEKFLKTKGMSLP